MTDVDDWYGDDPFRDADPDPEPNCHTCGDSGRWIDYNKRRPRFGRRRRSRRCRGCNPTRLGYWWWNHTWKIRNWWHNRRHLVTTADDPWKADEPPY